MGRRRESADTRNNASKSKSPKYVKTTQTTEAKLKRLGFVYDYGALATETAAKVYEIAKNQAPTTLSPGIENLEKTIVSYSAPIVGKVTDIAPKVISEADKRVDTVVSTVDKYVSKDNIEAFKKTRQESLKQIEEILSKLSVGSVMNTAKTQYNWLVEWLYNNKFEVAK